MIENIEKLIEETDFKNIYLTSYEAADKILNKYHNIDTTYRYMNLIKIILA